MFVCSSCGSSTTRNFGNPDIHLCQTCDCKDIQNNAGLSVQSKGAQDTPTSLEKGTKKPFLPESIVSLESHLREDTHTPRVHGIRTLAVYGFISVCLFFGGLKLMEIHARPSQSALAGWLFFGGLLSASAAIIGIIELVTGRPYSRWVSAWEKRPVWQRFLWLCVTVIFLILLLIAGIILYCFCEEMKNPGATKWF